MQTVRVRYTVREDFVETNKSNIKQVMQDLKALGNPNTKYASFIEEDGVTFMHFAMFPDKGTSDLLNNLPSFAKFRKELKESNLVNPPKAEKLTLVDAAYELFKK